MPHRFNDGIEIANLIAGPTGHSISKRKLINNSTSPAHLHPSWRHARELEDSYRYYWVNLGTGRPQSGVWFWYTHLDETTGERVQADFPLYVKDLLDGDIGAGRNMILVLTTGMFGTGLSLTVMYIDGEPDTVEIDETTRPDYVKPYKYYVPTPATR